MRVKESETNQLPDRPLRIAARKSDLARLQAYRVGDLLKDRLGVEVEYAFRASLGDVNQTDPLWKMPGKGVFTEDFLSDLIEGRADLVVHSWKDLPTEERPHTEIAATLPRADVRDLLLFRRDRFESVRVSGHLRILTSSPRRAYNLAPFLRSHLPFQGSAGSGLEIEFVNVRGNITTRLQKLLSQDCDALIVAKAAIDRLLEAPEGEFAPAQTVIREVLGQTRFMVLPLTVNPTAAAQGALAIEISRQRADLRQALAELQCSETYACVQKERQILASYGGGCHQKIGVNVLRRKYGDLTFLRGLTDAGEVLNKTDLLDRSVMAQPKAASANAIFPQLSGDRMLFHREPLPREDWAWAERSRFLWVARELAWPEGFTPQSPDSLVTWAAGLTTWRRLAERGVWVNGSSEGLGEDEEPMLDAILGTTPQWVKLTHSGSADLNPEPLTTEICATYRLLPASADELAKQLKAKTHFFWMSASAFARAIEIEPSIRDRHHASGPGLTHRYLKHALGDQASLAVYLDVESWRKAVLP